MLKDPGQIEFCLDRKGQRRADPKFRDGLYAWSDAIIGSVQAQKRAKVKVQPDAPSIQEKGLKSMVSEPMDEHVSYDNFFPQLVKAVKTLISGDSGLQEVLAHSVQSIAQRLTRHKADSSLWNRI